MQMTGNTTFITGGSSGIGAGLADAFHERGNQVIIGGRREDRLRAVCEEHPGMRWFRLDVTDAAAIREVAERAAAEFPKLNCVVNNAGMQARVDFMGPVEDEAIVREVETNLLGAIRVAAAFLPHLRSLPEATLINVSSGLAFVPLARNAVYCATKAAVHSWTLSLRHQLRGSGVKVVELIPPWVATELGGPGKIQPPASSGRAPMPLEAFIAEAIAALGTDGDELAIGDAKRLTGAACSETVRKVFGSMNP